MLGMPSQFKWKQNDTPSSTLASTTVTNSFSALETMEASRAAAAGNNRSKEPYHSKGSMEQDRYGKTSALPHSPPLNLRTVYHTVSFSLTHIFQTVVAHAAAHNMVPAKIQRHAAAPPTISVAWLRRNVAAAANRCTQWARPQVQRLLPQCQCNRRRPPAMSA